MADEATLGENRSAAWNTLEGHQRDWIFYLINTSYPVTVFIGVVLNTLAFAFLVRCRLWVKHEGYVYLVTILCTNIGVLLFSTRSFCLMSIKTKDGHYYWPADNSQVMCKLWNFLRSIFFVSGWPAVALLFTCYLRTGMAGIGRRCLVFAAKFCTLFASKVVVGVVLGCLVLLGLPYLIIYDLEGEEPYCVGIPYETSFVFQGVETILMLFLPFVVLIVLLLLPLCASNKGCDDPEPTAAAHNPAEEEVLADSEMRKLAIIISSLILLMQMVVVLSRAILGGIKGFPPILEVVHGMTLSVHPVICFTNLTMFRQGVRSQLRCCRRLLPSLGGKDGEEIVLPGATTEGASK